MDLRLSDEQGQLRDAVAHWARRRYGFAQRRGIVDGEGWSADVWRDLAEGLGILGLGAAAAPDPVDLMVAMEALGEALLVEPFVETVVTGASLLRSAGGPLAQRLLHGIAAGDVRLALAWEEPGVAAGWAADATVATRVGEGWRITGAKSVVTAAPCVTTLLVTARTDTGTSLFAVDPAAPGVTLTAYPTIDGRTAADVAFDGVTVGGEALLGAEGGALPWLERAGDATIAALGAEAIGVMRRMLADTIAYTGTRRQFGQPIARFQVLQHRMVDMRIHTELAAAAVLLATLKLDAPAAERARAASVAKVTVAEACRFVGQNAIQLHGGMGMSDETPVTHHFRRATVIEHELGSADAHVARFIDAHRRLAAA